MCSAIDLHNCNSCVKTEQMIDKCQHGVLLATANFCFYCCLNLIVGRTHKKISIVFVARTLNETCLLTTCQR